MDTDDLLKNAIEHLARVDRGSCSPGEHHAAEWIAAALRETGADAHVECERVHGTYWWPLGLMSALGIVAALVARRGKRLTGAALSGLAAGAVFDDVAVGRRLMRRLLPKQATANVIAEAGDRDAACTLLLVAHHDAAHSSVFFTPALAARLGRFSGHAAKQSSRLPPPMAPVAAAPVIVALGSLVGSRRVAFLGASMCGGIIASFVEMALRQAVPGANDNLTGVATLLGVARRLRERPIHGIRVLLVSTGAEESLMEGMRAFAAHHFPTLAAGRSHVLCVDSVGSSQLVLAEAEGLLVIRRYDARFNDIVAGCASRLGVALRRGLRMQFGTDGYVALRYGLPAAMLTSVNENGTPSNYHRATDTPERVDYERLADAVDVCDAVARELAASSTA